MKLYISLLDKILKTHLTKNEIDTLLFLLQVQDEMGLVVDVHWQEVAGIIGMAAQTFYNASYGLANKGFISMSGHCPSGEQNSRGFHTIKILVPSTPEEIESARNGTALVDDCITSGVIPVDGLKNYIKQAGLYLNLKDFSLINKRAFRRLQAEAKKLVLYLLWKKQHGMSVWGAKDARGNKIAPRDIVLTAEVAAALLGFTWQSGVKGMVVKRRVLRYFAGVVSSGLLPVNVQGPALVWSVENLKLDLPELPIHNSTPESHTDSIADTTNRRILQALLKEKGISANTRDVQDTLSLLDEQFRGVSGLKLLSVAVKTILGDCLKQHLGLIPSFINKQCRRWLGMHTQPETL